MVHLNISPSREERNRRHLEGKRPVAAFLFASAILARKRETGEEGERQGSNRPSGRAKSPSVYSITA